MQALQVVAVLVTLLMLGHAIHTEYFVTPSEGTPCTALPCHTLSHYLENTTQYFTSNTRISFLHGVHKINKSGVLHIKQVFNLILTKYNASSSHAATIICMKLATLRFENIVNLVVKHLSILYCGYPVVCFNTEDKMRSSLAVALMHITSLKLSDITVENSTGYAVLGVNILGNSSISHSSFIFNNYYTLSSTNCSYGRGTCRGGNMYLYYGSTVSASTNVISIDTCLFSDGVDISEGPQSSGLSIYHLMHFSIVWMFQYTM